MAEIISGITPQEAGFAYLKGQDMGYQAARDQQELQLRQRQLEAEQMAQIRQAALEQQREEARSRALLNERAQMGDAQALQQMALEAQAGISPDEKMMQSIFGTLQRITDPDARRLAVASIGQVLEERKAQQEHQAAQGAIERAGKNGLVDPEQYMQRLQAGEQPQAIAQELQGIEQQQTIKAMAMKKADAAMQQADALIQAATPGDRNRLAAEYILTNYQNSPADQEKPGSDADLIQKVQEALLGSRADQNARAQRMQDLQFQRAHSIPAGTAESIAQQLPVGGVMGALANLAIHSAPTPYEKPAPLRANAEKAKAEKGRRMAAGGKRSGPIERKPGAKTTKTYSPEEVGSLAVELSHSAKDDKDLLRMLKERGVQLTTENADAISRALGEWSTSVQSGAGADR